MLKHGANLMVFSDSYGFWQEFTFGLNRELGCLFATMLHGAKLMVISESYWFLARIYI